MDTVFTYITSKLINKVGDAIFVSGVSQNDSLKIKKEIADRQMKKPQNIAIDQLVFTAQYCRLYIPEDDKFAYLSLHGQDIKFAKKSGKVPYYGGGLIIGDKGYISRQQQNNLFESAGIELKVPLRSNQKEQKPTMRILKKCKEKN